MLGQRLNSTLWASDLANTANVILFLNSASAGGEHGIFLVSVYFLSQKQRHSATAAPLMQMLLFADF